MNVLQASDQKRLADFARQIRVTTLKELGHLGFGHLGGAMSVVELLAVLYGDVMKIDPQNPAWEERDWLVLSKGHAGPALYATLALKGYFPEEMLLTLNQGGTKLPSHADRNLTPGVDMTTGSLGQGFSTGLGVALGHRLEGKDNSVYIVLGDGECQEGQVWEAVLYAGNAKLDNLIVFVDYNKQQLDGFVEDINPLGDLGAKWEAFGWHAQEVDGHNVAEIYGAIKQAKAAKGKSSVIILHTIKGKGCHFAEGVELNHHMRFTQEQIAESLAILEGGELS
ncbi:MAG TPA: transketolase [Firmicutes bacterium]|nr:transketolase [Bacillota bacterium]